MLFSPQTYFIGIAAVGVAITSYLVYSSDYHFAILPSGGLIEKKTAFQVSRITSTTFLVKEYNDIYSEHPHIYVKVIPSTNTSIIIDTGCGGASNDSTIQITSLREFIETVKVRDNENRPLNEGGVMNYVVIETHCHYDHILGMEHFTDSTILASSYSPEFVSPSNFPENSLCKALGINTPSYNRTLVPHLHSITTPDDTHVPLGLTILHTPGHTPDELALYDEDEMMLYVGDSLYEYEPIIFPTQGSILDWFDSMDFLIAFVKHQNRLHKATEGKEAREVLINAGHVTVLRPALDVLTSAKAFLMDVVEGREEVKERRQGQDEVAVTYIQAGGRFSLRCPERLVLEAKEEI